MTQLREKDTVCLTCGKTETQYRYVCDQCKIELKSPYADKSQTIQLTGFDPSSWGSDGETDYYHFCSFDHLFRWWSAHIHLKDHWELHSIRPNMFDAFTQYFKSKNEGK